jgi:ribosomal protein S27AE
MRRRLRSIAFGVLCVTLAPVVILLLPILLPIALAVDARTMRRLASTRCTRCGSPVGLAELRRARAEAGTKAGAIVAAILASGSTPRVAIDWEVTCPKCGQAYVYPEYNARQPALLPKL